MPTKRMSNLKQASKNEKPLNLHKQQIYDY